MSGKEERVFEPAHSNSRPRLSESLALAEVVALFPKQRGRPRKPAFAERPCTDSFETVAAAVVGIASERKIWAAAKLRARSLVDKDIHLRPADGRVFQFLLEHVNPKKGCDWHGINAIAHDVGVRERTVQKAFERLGARGHILRTHEVVDVQYASRVWSTTLPTLVAAGLDVQRQRRPKHTPEKSPRDAQEIQLGHALQGTQTREAKPENEYSADAEAPAANLQLDLEKGTGSRFDKRAPLRARVTTWRYQDRAQLRPSDQQLYDRWRIAAGNVDKDRLIDEFCRYYRTERTHDAQLELVKYVERTRGQQRDDDECDDDQRGEQ